MDIMTKKERSKRMSLIKSKWTMQERKIHNFLKGRKIQHKMHPKLIGSPDIQVDNVLVFLHGCFWHKCPTCYREPLSGRKFWIKKVQNNSKRHDRNVKILKKEGYRIIVLWEHEIKKDISKALNKIKNSMDAKNEN